MLSKADDFPIHQLPEPIATAGTDRNFYDRYFFNGYAPDGAVFFAAALGVYPHLNIMDAAFAISYQGIQRNLHASRYLNGERLDTSVGPIKVEVIEPLVRLRVVVDKNPHGIRADLHFTARAAAIEEPRFTHRRGTRTFFDYTRMTQNGTWTGWIEIGGTRIEIGPDYMGTRDRSWGVRPIGAADPQPQVPPSLPQFYWLWAPLNFPDHVSLFDINSDSDGRPWHQNGAVAPVDNTGAQSAVDFMASADAALVFESGTRHAKAATINLRRWNGKAIKIVLELGVKFYMAGIGYLNPDWGHGQHKGPNELGYDEIGLAQVDNSAPTRLHIQAFCKAQWLEEDRAPIQGIGILEQLIVGPHAPSGFSALFDMAP
jgi:hypothetical protein